MSLIREVITDLISKYRLLHARNYGRRCFAEESYFLILLLLMCLYLLAHTNSVSQDKVTYLKVFTLLIGGQSFSWDLFTCAGTESPIYFR